MLSIVTKGNTLEEGAVTWNIGERPPSISPAQVLLIKAEGEELGLLKTLTDPGREYKDYTFRGMKAIMAYFIIVGDFLHKEQK